MKKYLGILAIVFLVACLFVPLVSASYVCPGDMQGTATNSLTLNIVHPSVGSSTSAAGQCFVANATCYLQTAQFRLLKYGAPSGNLTANLYAVSSGTAGTDAYPSGSPLATSGVLDAATLGGAYSTQTFTFDGSYHIISGTTYFIGVTAATTGFDTSNYVRVATSTSSVNAAQNDAYYRSSTWTAELRDVWFIINGDTESSGATPTPAPSVPSSTPNDGGMTALTNALLPILVPLLIVLIPAFLGLKFVGSWGFMAGLNVGVIIAYVVLGNTAYSFPLWGVVFIGIVDVLLVMKARG